MLVDDYLAALEDSNLSAVLALFADGAFVDSPLYGRMAAEDFYPALFQDTSSSRLTLKTILEGDIDGAPVVAFWFDFDFDWTLADGTPAPFTVMDVAELDAAGRITELHIIYDTAPIRQRFDDARERDSRVDVDPR